MTKALDLMHGEAKRALLEVGHGGAGAVGIKDVKSLETIDLQCNELEDRHENCIAQIVHQQCALKDVLRWKLGLRCTDRLQIEKLGVKAFNLARNNFSDYFAEKFAAALATDEYIKSVNLSKNRIGKAGLRTLSEAVVSHPSILCLDLRGNPCMSEKDSDKFVKAVQARTIDNIAEEVGNSFDSGSSRIKVDWIVPAALGLQGNRLDCNDRNQVNASQKRGYFVELCNFVAKKTGHKFDQVISAFFGEKDSEVGHLRKQLHQPASGNIRKKRSGKSATGPRSRSKATPSNQTKAPGRTSSPADARQKPKIAGSINKKAPQRRRPRPQSVKPTSRISANVRGESSSANRSFQKSTFEKPSAQSSVTAQTNQTEQINLKYLL